MDMQTKRLEDSYRKYPVQIPEELFREGFDFGKKLGLIVDENFDEIFSKETMSSLEKTSAWYFSTWPEQLKSYLKPVNIKQDSMLANYLTAERKILNLKKMAIGEKIVDLAKQKKFAREVSFGPTTKYLIMALSELLPEMNIKFVSYEPIQDNKPLTYPRPAMGWPADNTGKAISIFTIDDRRTSIEVQWNYPYRTLNKVNEYFKQIGHLKRVVQFEEMFSAWGLSYGVILINKGAVELENNPFIPFYSKNNLWVIDKEEITPEKRKYVEDIARKGLDVNELFEKMNNN